MLPRVAQVVDPFHCVQLANRALDEIRRRVQHRTKGHRRRRNDPLTGIRCVLLTGEERSTPRPPTPERAAATGDPTAKSPSPTASKQRLREFYRCTDIAQRTILSN